METIKKSTLETHQYLIDSKNNNKGRDSSKTPEELQQEKEVAEEHLYDRMCLDLPLYQDKIKRDKELYKEEFAKFLNVFIPKFNLFLESPAHNHKNIKEIFVFLAHLSHIFPKELAFLPTQLRDLLEHSHAIIHPDIRLAIIESFNLLRKKNLIEPVDILPLFFQLLTCQDKSLRQKLQEIIINDLIRINEKAKNQKVNKFIRNKCAEMLQNSNFKAARKTLNIMILLYKKKVWNDDKTVNILAQSCYSKDSKIAYASCKFFLSEYEEIDEESENDEMGELRQKYKLLGKGNNKKTKKRKDKIKTLMKAVERRETRKSKEKENKDFMPIDLINDPTTLSDKMFDRIKHVKIRKHYKLKVVLIRLIGRILGRHKIVIPNFFSFCASLVRPKQEQLSTILASIVEATHHMTSSSDLEPVINELYYYFICESYPAQIITIGVNTLRGIVERSPNCIKYDQYTAVDDLKKVKNKSVTAAVRSFINLLRDVNPDLMENKVKDLNYAEMNVSNHIDGIDLLKIYEGHDPEYQMECNELLTDKQLKKLRLLRMKDNAEAVQRIRLNLSKNDVNTMLGEKREKNADEKIITKKSNRNKEDKIEKKDKKKSDNNDLLLKEEDNDDEEIEEEEDEDEEMEEGEEIDEDDDASDLSDASDSNIDEDDIDMDEAISYESDEEGDEGDEEIEDGTEVLSEVDDKDEEDDAKEELNQLLDSASEQDANIEEESEDDDQSFVDEGQINTYKMTFRDRRIHEKNEEKEPFKLKRKQKTTGQKSNIEARKNKPAQMVIHKVKRKNLQCQHDKNLTWKIKNVKRQLGRFKRGNMIMNKKGVDPKKTKQKLSKKNKKKKLK